jgi:hypothetical protein
MNFFQYTEIEFLNRIKELGLSLEYVWGLVQ